MSPLMTAQQLEQALDKMAREIVAAAPPNGELAIVGIRRRGESPARRLLPRIAAAGRRVANYGVLDITLYRDDLSTIGPNAVTRGTEIEFDVTDTWLVLVDDVLYTGRSVRAALDALVDLGRPRAIKLAVLVDRGWRELPIQPDFVSLSVKTTAENIVKVKVSEIDGVDGVDLL
ncbi:MAG: bifunctional pyr operon transcriptional regulator/uracil phosphoribosyltransferase PyrR [Planctomycetes bacterium]|nr:bifunctional pyr operon transcriptional regulator/uracil phosphoribosyltransferase PyrR [Planctomycetota bacterium]